MKKCNHDCFHCIHDDCIIESISAEERIEIKERDKRYYDAIDSQSIIKARPRRKKYRGRIVIA